MHFDTLRTPDYSPLVVHFTKNARMVRHEVINDPKDPLYPYRTTPAFDRLKNIIQTQTIHSSPMPFLPSECRAVCFTECIWDGLTQLAESYSPYGIVFSKRLLFDLGGGPALYIRGDMVQKYGKEVPDALHPFIAPFDPEGTIRPGVPLDWLQEREWRIPKTLSFEYADIQFVLVNSVADVDVLVHHIGAQHLPEKKVIPMEVYRQIKDAWGEQ